MICPYLLFMGFNTLDAGKMARNPHSQPDLNITGACPGKATSKGTVHHRMLCPPQGAGEGC